MMSSEPRRFWNNIKAWWKYFIQKGWYEAGDHYRFSQKVFKERFNFVKQPHWLGIFYLIQFEI